RFLVVGFLSQPQRLEQSAAAIDYLPVLRAQAGDETVSDHRKTRTAAGPASRAAPPGLTGPPPGEAQASLSHRSRGLAAQSAWRAEGAGRARCPECLARRGCGPARAIVTPDAPPAIAARGRARV